MFLTIITFIIILSLLVFVHELGHFWVSSKMGVKAEEFGFGFPPRAIGIQFLKGKAMKKIAETEKIEVKISDTENSDGTEIIKETVIDTKQEIDELVLVKKWKLIKGGQEITYTADEQNLEKSTIYSINWVPLGGFVKIKGEDGGENDQADSFSNKKIWQRAVILLAGVTMNIILAMFLISLGYMIGLPEVLDSQMPGAKVSNRQIQVVEVLPDTPAAENGIKIGDILDSINGKTFSTSAELQNFVSENTGKPLEYSIKRGQEEIKVAMTPKIINETGQGGVGVAIVESGLVRYPFFSAIWRGIKTTVLVTWAIILAFYGLLKNLVLGHGVGADLSGPVGIAVLTGQVARLGFVYILQFAALLSINLAIINAFPFPALDGGRVLFLIIERIKGSPVKKEVEGLIHNVGFALLMLLVVFVTFKDVIRYSGMFKNLWEKIF